MSVSTVAMAVVALIMAVQVAFYYPKLPKMIAVHYDINLEPGLYIHKAIYAVLVLLLAVCTIWPFSTIVPANERINGAVVLVFFVSVNQFLFAANAEAKKLSPLIWVFVVLVVAYVGWAAYHAHA